MGTFSFLATEASGFGLNLNLFETNLINLGIVIGVLFYFGRNVLGNILGERRSRIEQEVRDAEKRQKDAAASLADAQQKLAKAQAEAEKIRAEAEENAKRAREAILAEAAEDIENLKAGVGTDVTRSRERAIAELRERVAAMAIERVESQLRGHLDDSAQQQLIDRSIAILGGSS